MIKIKVELSPIITVVLKLSPQTTIDQLTEYASNLKHFNKNSQYQPNKISCLSSKNGNAKINLWLTLPHKTLHPFQNQTCFSLFTKDSKRYKTQIRNYIKLQNLGNSKIVVRKKSDAKIYLISQYSKDQITRYQSIQHIIIIKQFLIKHNNLRSLPKLYHTFESKNAFNFVTDYIPLNVTEVVCLHNLKKMLINLFITLHELYSIGFPIKQLNINDLKIDYDLNFKLFNLNLISKQSQVFCLQNQKISCKFLELIREIFEDLSLIEPQRQEDIYAQKIIFFLGQDFKNFIVTLQSRQIKAIEQLLELPWISQRNQPKQNLKYLTKLFTLSNQISNDISETTRNEIEDQYSTCYIPNTNFFSWDAEDQNSQKVQLRNTNKKKPKSVSTTRNATKRRKNHKYLNLAHIY